MDNREMYPIQPGQVATRDVLTRRELADRWGYRSTRSIERLCAEVRETRKAEVTPE